MIDWLSGIFIDVVIFSFCSVKLTVKMNRNCPIKMANCLWIDRLRSLVGLPSASEARAACRKRTERLEGAPRLFNPLMLLGCLKYSDFWHCWTDLMNLPCLRATGQACPYVWLNFASGGPPLNGSNTVWGGTGDRRLCVEHIRLSKTVNCFKCLACTISNFESSHLPRSGQRVWTGC